ncbi:fimbrial protein [Providencia alcalifaciens]|uniref:fimbrial protein n=1 Tax=Providencia alcalifaciens TaxID=126385 RepID=UPI00259F5484|nr:fimbrial protein [Providencia rettgeri]ELT5687781.1 fimbrial protein [Providencia rettgeri]
MKYRLICSFLFLMPLSSYAVDMWCGPGYDDFNVVKGKGEISNQPNPILLSFTRPILPPAEAYNTGLSTQLPVKCGFVSNNVISGYKGGDGRMVFSGNWTPLITSVNSSYVSDVSNPGEYNGDWRPQERMRVITNSQIRNNVIKFKNGVTRIPAGTRLFDIHLYFKLDLKGTGDPTLRTYIPVVTEQEIIIVNPTCDFSSPNANVTLNTYQDGINTKKQVPLTINCNSDNNARIKLTGQVYSSDTTIFQNIATNNPASGIGIRIYDTNNNIVKANDTKNYSFKTNQNTTLFSADYARLNQTLKAGNVQSIINVELSYD